MTSREDLELEQDRALDDFLDAAAEEADGEAVDRPSFGAVLERARRLDPGLVPALPPLGTSSAAPLEPAVLAAALAPFVAAARAEAELDVARLESHAPPGLPRVGSPRVTRWIAVAGTLVAAAAILLLWGLFDAERMLQADASRDDHQAMDRVDAERRVLEAETGGDALGAPLRKPRRARPGEASRVESPALPDEPAPLEPIEPPSQIPDEPAPLEPETVPNETPPAAPRGGAAPADRSRDALRRLDRTAAERLTAGDAAGAEQAYRALVRRGGRSSLAELAYGDLFTLVHRRGDPQAQRVLWSEYLRKFPRGRFADDAQAGLCRQTKGERARECWARYLDQFPTGAYHRQAERVRDGE